MVSLLVDGLAAGVPYALRRLARDGTGAPDDVLLALPGVVYRRDAIDRQHTGTPHQLDLWRVTRSRTFGEPDLQEMLTLLLASRCVAWNGGQLRPATHTPREEDRWMYASARNGLKWPSAAWQPATCCSEPG